MGDGHVIDGTRARADSAYHNFGMSKATSILSPQCRGPLTSDETSALQGTCNSHALIRGQWHLQLGVGSHATYTVLRSFPLWLCTTSQQRWRHVAFALVPHKVRAWSLVTWSPEFCLAWQRDVTMATHNLCQNPPKPGWMVSRPLWKCSEDANCQAGPNRKVSRISVSLPRTSDFLIHIWAAFPLLLGAGRPMSSAEKSP